MQKLVNSNPQIVGLRLYVEKENEGALKTYRKLGMIETSYHIYQWLK